MKLDLAQLERAAAETGFQVEPRQKVLRLLDLLDGLRSHPFLAERLVLKGGTALNLFVLESTRLSVDVDLNYVGALERETMLAERPQVERAVRAVCERQDIGVRRVPGDHAGGKWRLTYDRAEGGTGTLELDLNFVLRTPLWPPTRRDSPEILGLAARRVPVLDLHELAGGKLAALFGRSASRDLYDASRILARTDLDRRRLRLAFVLYGAMNRRDWRTVSIEDVDMLPGDAERMLVPLLRADLAPHRGEVEEWSARLVERCRERLSAVLPLEPHEREFLERVNGQGEVRPDLLTEERDMHERIRRHPALAWKALNVRRRSGRAAAGDEQPATPGSGET